MNCYVALCILKLLRIIIAYISLKKARRRDAVVFDKSTSFSFQTDSSSLFLFFFFQCFVPVQTGAYAYGLCMQVFTDGGPGSTTW